MLATISATEVKNRFGEVIRRIYKNRETLIVERGGLPVMVMMPLQEYESLKERQLVEFSRRLGRAAEQQGLTEEQLAQELEEDKTIVYQETYCADTAA